MFESSPELACPDDRESSLLCIHHSGEDSVGVIDAPGTESPASSSRRVQSRWFIAHPQSSIERAGAAFMGKGGGCFSPI
jgi:hypothetical protein